MLRYLSSGKRYFGEHPMPPHRRVNWEFLAVIDGEMSPVIPNHAPAALSKNTLWVFSPACSHGWVGKKKQACEVVIFHFSKAPSVLEQVIPPDGCLAVPLLKEDKASLRRLNLLLQPHYWKPTMISEAYGNKVLAELTLLCLRDLPAAAVQVRRNHEVATILKVEAWIQAHLSDPPTVAAAAKATSISESTLYRLFNLIRKMSPQQAIVKFKVDRAMELIANMDFKLEEVAAQCGFSNASALCRAFKKHKGCSPKSWHREIFVQYKRPLKTGPNDHARHGERVSTV